MFKSLSIAALLMTLSTGAMAAELVITITGQSDVTFKKVSKKRFEKISAVNTGSESVDLITKKGTQNISTQELNVADDGSKAALEVTGKNIVRIEDVKEQISAEVQAEVNASILGTIRGINISGKVLDGVYAESYKRTGLDILKNLNISGGALTSKIQSSDMNCVADGDILNCKQTQELKFSIQGM